MSSSYSETTNDYDTVNLQQDPPIQGYAKPEFEEVRNEFTENFQKRGEIGAACTVYHKKEKVVDL